MDAYDSRDGVLHAVAFFKTAQVITRIVCLVFSVIVFACIADGVDTGYPHLYCSYNGDNEVCDFGIAVGIIAFVAAVTFLFIDGVYKFQGGAFKKNSTIADLAVSSLWTVMWFVSFCYLADRWRVSSPGEPLTQKVTNNARTAIVFCFFSIISWAVLSVLAFRRMRKIDADYGLAYTVDRDRGYHQPSPGDPRNETASHPQDSSQSYQRQTFSGQEEESIQPH